MNVAFTWSGIETLSESPEYFSDAFKEGIHGSVHRRRVLGDDMATSTPEDWLWGGPRRPIDMVLMLFVDERDSLDDAIRESSPPPEAMTRVAPIKARRLRDAQGREHFGFTDGISQPILEGSTDAERFPESMHVTALGEFVLGYHDAAGKASAIRTMPADRSRCLRCAVVPTFGMNGSYLVVRQLYQDVAELLEVPCPTEVSSTGDEIRRRRGNWRRRSSADGPTARRSCLMRIATTTSSGSARTPYGYGCPMGAHVRRANPRDSLGNTNLPFRRRNDHRILRRGRSYGNPPEGSCSRKTARIAAWCFSASTPTSSGSSSSSSRTGSTTRRLPVSATSAIRWSAAGAVRPHQLRHVHDREPSGADSSARFAPVRDGQGRTVLLHARLAGFAPSGGTEWPCLT